jgi:hypothetical protein
VRRVRREHHRATADPVGEHAAAQHEHHLGHDPGRYDVAEVGRGSVRILNVTEPAAPAALSVDGVGDREG